ncbi:exoribonuclease 2 [Pragia fontium]|uniref:Exoribonuclease 2 n=1 Tax=Pragia fontium TaxID=82985 RepID=A0ABQ5LFF6_9GAMM|nr:exoribonuclease II [Pragia fontium]GKX61677.1 exoribonuclease 2 [Pragia fontium]
MFQNNPLLAQLKQQLHANTPRVEGTVKGTEKGFGFLEVDSQKSYFIPPPQMKKVMHGDRISASIHTEKDRELVEPEELIEPFLTRFIGRIQQKNGRLFIVPDHPLIKDVIPCKPAKSLTQPLNQGDWVVAEMSSHPLTGDRGFNAQVTEYITFGDDHLAPWWVTLSRHQLDRKAPEWQPSEIQDEGITRRDLTAFNFITIDSESTEDMDDALFAEQLDNDKLKLFIAIADPTAYITPGSELDVIALKRAFTNYLPGFNVPMLPRELSDNLCSLLPNQRRPALVCEVVLAADGAICGEIEFFSAWIMSKDKLDYDKLSDWLEESGTWQPENEQTKQQIQLLHHMALRRIAWRTEHALMFKERPDYRFVLGEKGEVLDIITEHRRIANRIVEEAMIVANICAARVLKERLGYGIFNVHAGFDPTLVEQAINVLQLNGAEFNKDEILTLDGFCKLRRFLDTQPTSYLDSRVRKYQTYAEISTTPGSHFGLGLDAYATWTSPIRKYGDIINHRLLKALIHGAPSTMPDDSVMQPLTERRRFNRMAERDVSDWLYARFLQDKAGTDKRYLAEILDISRGGMRIKLLENGAVAFIPAPFIHAVRDELVCSAETGTIQLKGEVIYRQGDTLEVILAEVRIETRSIIARPAPSLA